MRRVPEYRGERLETFSLQRPIVALRRFLEVLQECLYSRLEHANGSASALDFGRASFDQDRPDVIRTWRRAGWWLRVGEEFATEAKRTAR